MYIAKWKKPVWEAYEWFQLYDILEKGILWKQ